MGQKTHPLGFRLGIVKDWKSRWYAERDFPRLLKEDETIRSYLHRRLAHAALSKVEIERKPSKIVGPRSTRAWWPRTWPISSGSGSRFAAP